MKRKHISNFLEVLEQRGIKYLTGEADGTSMRLLFDLTEEGALLLNDALGIVADPSQVYPAAWNSGSKYSALIFRDAIAPLAIFSLLREGKIVFSYKAKDGNTHYGYVEDFEAAQLYESLKNASMDGSYRLYHANGTAHGGLRNQHAFSGRIY